MSRFQEYLENYYDMKEDRREVFTFLGHQFDVSLAKRLIREDMEKPDTEESAIEIAHIDVDKWSQLFQKKEATGPHSFSIRPGILVNEKHAKTKKLNRPLIVIQKSDLVIIIDGWHRLKKAEIEGVKTLPVYIISDPAMIKRITI